MSEYRFRMLDQEWGRIEDRKRMNEQQLLKAIQRSLSGVEWGPDTLDGIARLMSENGYPIEDLEP